MVIIKCLSGFVKWCEVFLQSPCTAYNHLGLKWYLTAASHKSLHVTHGSHFTWHKLSMKFPKAVTRSTLYIIPYV
jgi:hypothetical protein